MNPQTLKWQASACSVIFVLQDVFGVPSTGISVCLLGLVAALALNYQYARVLGPQGRTARRMHGDRLVTLEVAGTFAPGAILAAIFLAVGYQSDLHIWDFTHTSVSALLTIASGFGCLIMLSSLVDWYYIRPRLDGIVWQPPCKATDGGKSRWKVVTRRWYLHRGLATVAYFVFAVSIATVIVIVLAEHAPIAAGVVGGVSGISGVLLVFASTYREQIPIVAKWSLSPAFYLGDEIHYRALGEVRDGYVLHVSLPVVKLVLLSNGWPTGRIAEPKNTDIAAGDVERSVSRLCEGGCLRLNPECVHTGNDDERRLDRRSRSLIL